MVLLPGLRVIQLLVSLTFGDPSRLSLFLFSLLQSACMVMEMLHVAWSWSGHLFSKNRPVGLQMAQLECRRVIQTHSVILFWGPLGVPFLCMQDKGNAACGLIIKWKYVFQKYVYWAPNGATWNLECRRVIQTKVLGYKPWSARWPANGY